MAKNNNLNDFLTDIADAIRAKKGTEEPINAQDFANEISTIEGGSELEGEYYLAKPNGRYWKHKLAYIDNYPKLDYFQIPEEQKEVYMALMKELLPFISYSGIITTGNPEPSSTWVFYDSPIYFATMIGMKLMEIDYESYFCYVPSAFAECGGTIRGITYTGIVDLIRLMSDGGLDEMSDDEVLAMVSEMFMIEQVTKEEYESWHNW